MREGCSHAGQELSQVPLKQLQDHQEPDAEEEYPPLRDMRAEVLRHRAISLVQGPDLAQRCPSGTIDKRLLEQMGNLRTGNIHVRETHLCRCQLAPLKCRGKWGAALGVPTGRGSASQASGCPEAQKAACRAHLFPLPSYQLPRRTCWDALLPKR